jgi:uncharacterized protein (TIRG00374 family)
MNPATKNALKNAFKFGLMAGIIYYLYAKGLLDFTKVRAVLADPVVLAAGVSLILGTSTLCVVRWRMLLAGQGIAISFSEAFRLTFIGMFFNTALPGAVSGDVVKGYYIVRKQPDGKGKSKAFATLFLDRILGVSGLVIVAFSVMAAHYASMADIERLRPLIAFITLTFTGLVVFYGFMLKKWRFTNRINETLKRLPLGSYLSKIFEAFKCYEDSPGIILGGLLLSVTVHTCIILFIRMLAGNLGGFEMVPPAAFFLLTPLGLLVTAVPVAPAGLGTGHAAFFALFQLVGSTGGADLFTVFVAFQLFINLSGGAFYLRYKHTHPSLEVSANAG